MAACRSCSASVFWVETEAKDDKPARRMPLDADAEGRPLTFDDGNLVVVRNGDPPVVRYVAKGPNHHRSHFSSCPQLDRWRKK